MTSRLLTDTLSAQLQQELRQSRRTNHYQVVCDFLNSHGFGPELEKHTEQVKSACRLSTSTLCREVRRLYYTTRTDRKPVLLVLLVDALLRGHTLSSAHHSSVPRYNFRMDGAAVSKALQPLLQPCNQVEEQIALHSSVRKLVLQPKSTLLKDQRYLQLVADLEVTEDQLTGWYAFQLWPELTLFLTGHCLVALSGSINFNASLWRSVGYDPTLQKTVAGKSRSLTSRMKKYKKLFVVSTSPQRASPCKLSNDARKLMFAVARSSVLSVLDRLDGLTNPLRDDEHVDDVSVRVSDPRRLYRIGVAHCAFLFYFGWVGGKNDTITRAAAEFGDVLCADPAAFFSIQEGGVELAEPLSSWPVAKLFRNYSQFLGKFAHIINGTPATVDGASTPFSCSYVSTPVFSHDDECASETSEVHDHDDGSSIGTASPGSSTPSTPLGMEHSEEHKTPLSVHSASADQHSVDSAMFNSPVDHYSWSTGDVSFNCPNTPTTTTSTTDSDTMGDVSHPCSPVVDDIFVAAAAAAAAAAVPVVAVAPSSKVPSDHSDQSMKPLHEPQDPQGSTGSDGPLLDLSLGYDFGWELYLDKQ